MSERRDPDDDLSDLLADLDRTLGDLREELRDRERSGRADERDGDRDDRPARRRRERRGGPTAHQAERYGYRRREERDDTRSDRRDRPFPRPPSLGEMVRFTEEYTIPTIISMLEAAIRSLELLRGVLRLADPQRSVFDDDDRRRSTADRLATTSVGREALSGVDRALDDLRDALSGIPEDEESRGIVTDARDLMSEIEARIEEAERRRERSTYGYRERDRSRDDGREDDEETASDRRDRGSARRERGGPTTIDVSDEDGEDEEGSLQVDVDAELASIRREIRGDDEADGPESDGSDGGGESEDGDNRDPNEKRGGGNGNDA